MHSILKAEQPKYAGLSSVLERTLIRSKEEKFPVLGGVVFIRPRHPPNVIFLTPIMLFQTDTDITCTVFVTGF